MFNTDYYNIFINSDLLSVEPLESTDSVEPLDSFLPDPDPIFNTDYSYIKDNIPNYLCCPISLLLIKDPIITNDGYTYDRESLEIYLKKSNISPITRESLFYFIKNRSIRDIITDYINNKKIEIINF